jgi:hypothetical protein
MKRLMVPLPLIGAMLGVAGFAWSLPALADCTLALGNSRVDFGTLDRSSLVRQGNQILLGERSLGLTLSCDDDSDMLLFYRDSARDAGRFAFGPQGDYEVSVRDASLDGMDVTLGETGAAGEAPTRGENRHAWRPQRGLVPMKGASVVRGKVLQAQLDIVARAPQAALRVRDQTQWVSQASILAPDGKRTAELDLLATIMPVSCEPLLSNGGRVDLGRHPASTLNRAAETELATQSLELSLHCDGAARVALRTLDNRNGSASTADEGDYGLGLSGTNPVGRYRLQLVEPQVVGWGAVTAIQSRDAGNSWSATPGPGAHLLKGALLGFTDAAGAASGPGDLQDMTATITVTAFIAPSDTLDLRAPVELDGSATLEVVYL